MSAQRIAMTCDTVPSDHDVVIVGGGPTGMVLAGELTLAGVDVGVLERRASPVLEGSRAGGLQSRTIEVFDQRGIADRFLAEGQVAQIIRFGGNPLDISDFPTRHPYGLGIWQNDVERILSGWAAELGVPIYRDQEATGCAQDASGVEVSLASGRAIRAQYLVGCDGGRSVIRRAAGIAFPGWDPSLSCLSAEVEMTGQPELGMRYDATGLHALGRLQYEVRGKEVVYANKGPIRVMVTEKRLQTGGVPGLPELREALDSVYGTDFGVHSPTWISRFTDATRQASRYRTGRILLAGDAAHIHAPDGGQGLNIGVQDAVNLGWKLGHVVRRHAPESLLDTYHAERHPVAARVLRHTMAAVALRRGDERSQALRDATAELLGLDEPRRKYGAMLSGLDIHYDLGDGHPLVGRRMPDLDLLTPGGPRRLFSFLHDARFVLLNSGVAGEVAAAPWANRVHLVDGTHHGAFAIPLLGEISAPASVLIRPDGHVAWAGEPIEGGLREALVRWCGRPASP